MHPNILLIKPSYKDLIFHYWSCVVKPKGYKIGSSWHLGSTIWVKSGWVGFIWSDCYECVVGLIFFPHDESFSKFK